MAEDKAKKVSPKSVMTKEKPAAKKESEHKGGKGKHKHKITHIEHHSGGGHTVRHSPGEENEVSYAAPDLATVNAGMQQNVGEAEPQGAEPAPAAPAPAAPAAPAPQPGV